MPHRKCRAVPNCISQDTVETLETLLEQAKAGELVGLAYVAVYRGAEYECDTTGYAAEHTTLTIGMMRVFSSRG